MSLFRSLMMSGKIEKPTEMKTLISVEPTGNWQSCDMPVVNNGNYYFYLKISSNPINGTLFQFMANEALSTNYIILVDSYLGKPRLHFNGVTVTADKSFSNIHNGSFPATICASLVFVDGEVIGGLYDGNSTLISPYKSMGTFKVPYKFNAFTAATRYVSKVMIRAYDNA